MTTSAVRIDEYFDPAPSRFEPLVISFSTPHEYLAESAEARLARRAVRGVAQALPHPRSWAYSVLQATLESLTGFRPVTHLSRWVSPEVYDALARRAALAARVAEPTRAQRPAIRNVRASSVSKGRVDVIATILDGDRIRAVAIEMIVRRSRWIVTEIQIG